MTVSFEHTTDIHAPIETAFDLSLDIDAHLDSMSGSNERAIDGVTTMVDSIGFDAPLGPIGRVVERLVLGRYLQSLIEQRSQFLKSAAETPTSGVD